MGRAARSHAAACVAIAVLLAGCAAAAGAPTQQQQQQRHQQQPRAVRRSADKGGAVPAPVTKSADIPQQQQQQQPSSTQQQQQVQQTSRAPAPLTAKVMRAPEASPLAGLTTAETRAQFVVPRLFVPGRATLTYTTIDRMLVGGVYALPRDATSGSTGGPVTLANSTGAGVQEGPLLAAREAALFNLGPAPARVRLDGGGAGAAGESAGTFDLAVNDTLYVPSGTREVSVETLAPDAPAKLFLVSAPCGVRTKAAKVSIADALAVRPYGTKAGADLRTLYRLIGPATVPSCQLTVGITVMHEGGVWNQNPAHVHERRSEVYLYHNMAPDARVLHVLGEPRETRHVFVANEEAVLCPPWSVHFGVGTGPYSLLWAMAGENQDFDDRAPVAFADML